MIEGANRNRRRCTCELWRGLALATTAERARSATVADVLNLHDDVVRIGVRQFGDRRIRIRTHPDSSLDLVRREHLHHALRIEPLHAESEVIDPVAAAGTPRPFAERDELRPRTYREHGNDAFVPVSLQALHAR